MKLNHLGLTVTDPGASADFLARYFGLEELGKRSSKLIHLRDDDGLILSLFREGWMGGELSSPAGTHIGFILGSEAEVDAIHARLSGDGFAPPKPERSHGYTFTFTALGGIAVEVVC